MSIFGHTKDVANEVRSWVGTPMTWVSLTAHSTDLQDFAHSIVPVGAPIPNHANPATRLVCFDLFLLALFERGWATRADLLSIYSDFPKGMDMLRATGLGASLNTYTVGSLAPPNQGHIVFFNGLQHVAMATGNVATHLGTNGTEIMSFWTDNLGNPPVGNGPVANTLVMLDTIERLAGVLAPLVPGALVVNTAKPRWR